MGFSIFRTAMTALICIFLLMLFLLPPQYISRFSEEAESLLSAAISHLERGDEAQSLRCCEALAALVSDSMPALERFLNHSDVDSLGAVADAAMLAMRIGDTGTAAQALTEARSILSRLREIELFSWNNLL